MSTKAITLNSKKSVGALVKDWMSLVGIAILIVVFSIISYVKFGAQYFLTWSNWKNILLQSSTVAIVALGQSIMLLTGNFDLSLGSMVCLTSCVGAILMKNVGMSTGLAILIMFAIGLAVGAVNGFMVSYVCVPAMIATLGTQYICYGLAKLLTQAVPIANMPDSISFLGRGYIFGGVFPVCVLLMIIVYAIAQFVTSKTRVGQTMGETMAYNMPARLGAGNTPSQMHAERVDGWNPLAVIDAYKRKMELIKNNEGPVLLDVVTYRLVGHSTSDQNAYRTKEEIEDWRSHDPIVKFREALVEAGVESDEFFAKLLQDTADRMTMICRAADDKEISPYVDFDKNPDYLANLMFSNEHVRSMGAPDQKLNVTGPKESCKRYADLAKKEHYAFDKDGNKFSDMKVYNIRDAIFEPLINKYYEDPTLVAYGEDVRDWGGAYAVYRGLMDVIPHSRLFNSPISEAAIVGTAVGYCMCGGRAVVELMYCDFLGRAGDEVFNQMSKWQAMSAGILKMPMILRMSVGAKYGAQHSQDWVAIVSHIPGLKVFFPATPYEAKGIMQAALNGTDPCVIFESQRIYGKGEEFHEGGVPAEEYEWAPGAVNKVRDGKDLTILTIGATLYRAVDAAKTLSEKYGIEADVINMPSLVPLDYTDLIASVKKTGRVVLASDACARGTFLNEIAENLTNMCFDYLDAPPVVIGARNWITPPHEFDKYFFPYAEWIIDAVNARLIPLEGYTSTTTPDEAEIIRRNKLGV